MTPSELLALVGRAWVRLLLYPGGLSMFAAVWFALCMPAFLNREGREGENKRILALFVVNNAFTVAAPWLAVALLPLPGAVNLGRGIDVVVALALLDVPLLHAIGRELRSVQWRKRGVARLAAALNGYPTLVLATLLLASGGSLEVGQLAQVPAAGSVGAIQHWIGALGFAVALPPVIGFGPFAVPVEAGARLALRLRAVGLWALAALPWMAPLDGQIGLALPPLVLALLVWAFHRATRGQPARTWAKGYLALNAVLLVILLAGAAWQLALRLQ